MSRDTPLPPLRKWGKGGEFFASAGKGRNVLGMNAQLVQYLLFTSPAGESILDFHHTGRTRLLPSLGQADPARSSPPRNRQGSLKAAVRTPSPRSRPAVPDGRRRPRHRWSAGPPVANGRWPGSSRSLLAA